MKNILPLLLLYQIFCFGQDFIQGCGTRPLDLLTQRTTRIVGGRAAKYGEIPWQVALFYNGLYICGGALIFSRWVLTAGHCANLGIDLKLLTVRLGEYDLTSDYPQRHVQVGVKLKIIHENFTNIQSPNFDVGLLKLEKDIDFSSNIQIICLPVGHDSFKGEIASVGGWGSLKSGQSSNLLQIVEVPILTNKHCEEWMNHVVHANIRDEWMCAGFKNGGKDACRGDSGSPLWLKMSDGYYYVVGISTGGLGCGMPYLPGVYTRVNQFTPWIVNTIYADTMKEKRS